MLSKVQEKGREVEFVTFSVIIFRRSEFVTTKDVITGQITIHKFSK
jgi:hypothetical protein